MRRYGVHFRCAGRYQIFNKRRRSVGDVACCRGSDGVALRERVRSISDSPPRSYSNLTHPPSLPASNGIYIARLIFLLSSPNLLSLCSHGHLRRDVTAPSAFQRGEERAGALRRFSLLINDTDSVPTSMNHNVEVFPGVSIKSGGMECSGTL